MPTPPSGRLKNQSSQSPRVFETIQKILVAHKVREVHYEYDAKGSGRIVALSFSIDVEGRLLSFRLPARVENVERILYGKWPTDRQKEQAYRTAWANIRDWVDAQMAMIDTGMVRAEEVFMPYLLNAQGQTFYEALRERQFLLPAPSADEER